MAINESLFWAKVDKSGDCWEWTGARLPRGYGIFGVNRRPRGAHRVSYELQNGPIPAGMEVDHICHNPPCVNPEHLRAVTIKQNAENRSGAQSNSKSGVRGVSWHKVTKKWRAVVHHNGQYIHIGYFHDMKDAEAAAIARRNELFTHNGLDRVA